MAATRTSGAERLWSAGLRYAPESGEHEGQKQHATPSTQRTCVRFSKALDTRMRPWWIGRRRFAQGPDPQNTATAAIEVGRTRCSPRQKLNVPRMVPYHHGVKETTSAAQPKRSDRSNRPWFSSSPSSYFNLLDCYQSSRLRETQRALKLDFDTGASREQ